MDRSRLFDREFEVILADTARGREVHHQIRYQVYCEERGYEDSSAFPDGQEVDQWDQRSVAFLVRTRQTQEWVGTLRLILPGKQLPAQELCLLDRGAIGHMKPAEVGELSRLCIVPAFRKRPRFKHARGYAHPSREQVSEVLLGLLRAAAHYSDEARIRYWYLLTTKSVARLMKRLHLPLSPAGTGIDHRGERFPFLIHVARSQQRARTASAAIDSLLQHDRPYRLMSELDAPDTRDQWLKLVANGNNR